MRLILLLCCMALGLSASPPEPWAQGPAPGRGSNANLPKWARPQPSYEQPSSPRDASAQPSSPALPPPPDPVPLGGLEWLALAGGAYAVNRMRRRSGVDGDSSEALP